MLPNCILSGEPALEQQHAHLSYHGPLLYQLLDPDLLLGADFNGEGCGELPVASPGISPATGTAPVHTLRGCDWYDLFSIAVYDLADLRRLARARSPLGRSSENPGRKRPAGFF